MTFLLTLILSGGPQERPCTLVPSALLEEPRSTFSGVYKNESFGYSVVIPGSLKGFDADLATHHGFGVVLGEAPQSYLEVEGRANSLGHRTAREAARRFVQSLNRASRRVEATTIRRSKLGELEAVEAVASYSCGSHAYRVASTFALSPRKDVEFQVTLSSPADRFAGDRLVLDRLLESWTYVGR